MFNDLHDRITMSFTIISSGMSTTEVRILQMCHPCLIAPNMAKVCDKGAGISD